MKKNTLLLLSLFLFGLLSHSQNLNKAINSFQNETNAIITINRNLQVPSFIKLPVNKELYIQGKTVKEKAHNFLLKNKALYAITNLDETLPPNGILKTDNYGLKHYEVKQFHEGVPVYDGGLKFHFTKNENISSINGNIIPDIKLNVTPRLQKAEANAKALDLVKVLNRSRAPLKIISNELIIFPKGLVQGAVTSKHLVYHIEVRNDLDVREFLFIDAHTGKLVEQFTGIAHALDRILYEGTTSNQTWKEGFSFPGFLNEWQQAEVVAAGQTYHFFNNAFGYTSYDGLDAQMVTINNNPDIDCPNATWNGVSANYCDGTAADDVVAHEWGHAYNEYTSNLIYAYQSGALNEAFSDIWGETIDLLNNYNDDGEDLSLRSVNPSSLRWIASEDATAFGTGGIRDMWDPTKFDDPGKVSDSDYHCLESDNGGVHINSGIPNHAYALIVDGGTFNGQTISGLGFVKAAHIFWRAESEYLTSTSDFTNFADAIEASCTDLIGINLQGLSTTDTPAGLSGETITAADYNEVVKALIAVELRNDNACNFASLLAATDPLCGASSSNPIFSEDWESGIGSGWTITQLPEFAGAWESREWILETNLPRDRAGSAIFAPNPVNGDCALDLQNGIIRLESPTITMPNYLTGTFDMAFNHNISSETDYDGGNIKYSLDGGAWTLLPSTAFTANPYNNVLTTENDNDNPMVTEEAFSGADENSNSSVWGTSIINLSSLGVAANSNIKLRWEFGSDGCNGRIGWYVDEIVVYNCAEALSINDFDFLDNNVSIYPNPSSGTFNIEMKSISDFRYDIYDITGKAIMNSVDIINNSFEVNLNDYSKGVYFFKLYSSEGSVTKKLLIQ